MATYTDYADPFNSRQLSFMRALLHDGYLAHRSEVHCRQIGYMKRHPGVDFYTLFWYTEGKVDLDVHAIREYSGTYDWGRLGLLCTPQAAKRRANGSAFDSNLAAGRDRSTDVSQVFARRQGDHRPKGDCGEAT